LGELKMTGLEKIIKAIEVDSQNRADKILAEGKEESDGILSSAKKEAEITGSKIRENIALETKAILNRTESSAKLIRRQLILDGKQKLIGEIILKAKNKLTSLSDTEYFDIILRIVKKNAHNEAGIIMFSKTDLERLPQNFLDSLQVSLKDIRNASLTISEEAAQIDGGFILKYGEIEENCSFEALFIDSKDKLQDKINAFLFD
jgi:V/A-type H+-transporting ATPase subunit E